MTPTAAAEELAPLAGRLNSLNDSVRQLLLAFEAFEIGAEELEPGEFEVGVLIPRPAVSNSLESLGAEFVAIDGILAPFYELVTGSRPDVEVRSIGSSNFELYLAAAPGVAASFAFAASKVMGLYQQLLDIRLAREQLKQSGMKDEALQEIFDLLDLARAE
jgi:hypothetical protein